MGKHDSRRADESSPLSPICWCVSKFKGMQANKAHFHILSSQRHKFPHSYIYIFALQSISAEVKMRENANLFRLLRKRARRRCTRKFLWETFRSALSEFSLASVLRTHLQVSAMCPSWCAKGTQSICGAPSIRRKTRCTYIESRMAGVKAISERTKNIWGRAMGWCKKLGIKIGGFCC